MWLIKTLVSPIAEVEVETLDLAPRPGEGLIIATNHRSYLDIFLALIIFQRWGVYPHFIVREDLLRLPILGLLLRCTGAVPASKDPRAARLVLRQAHELLRSGAILVLAPEGGIPRARDRVDGIGSLRRGVGHLAHRLGTPILLLAGVNSDVAWRQGSPLPRVSLRPSHRPVVRVGTEYLALRKDAPPAEIIAEVHRGLIRVLARLEAEAAE